MLANTNFTDKTHDNHPNKDFVKQEKSTDTTLLVSWLFLAGSLLFMLDSVLEIIREISIHSVIALSASLLLTIGSVLFIPNTQQQ